MFYNSHIHTFKLEDVPERFLPINLNKYLSDENRANRFANILKKLHPSDRDALSRYARFLEIGNMESQKIIFEECQRFYPKDTRFVVLPMDMAYMEAGKVPRNYEDQIKELGELALANNKVIPFFAVDPRRENVLDLLRKGVTDYGIKGIKLYTPLGYFPYDKRLYPVYEYCQQEKLAVISHCSPHNAVHYRGRIKDIEKLLRDAKYAVTYKKRSKKYLCANFAYPENYRDVLTDFPDLNICLAHFGSGSFWKEYLDNPGNPHNWFQLIREMIEEYNNLYTDLSFTLNDTTFFSLIKILLENEKLASRVLFGSDFYMVETEATERRFGLDLRAYIGENHFNKIAKENPERFLQIQN